jgi:hypothetical protein
MLPGGDRELPEPQGIVFPEIPVAGPLYPSMEEIAGASSIEELNRLGSRLPVFGGPDEAKDLRAAITRRAVELQAKQTGYMDDLMKGAAFTASAVVPGTKENLAASTFMWNAMKALAGPVAETVGAAWGGQEKLAELVEKEPETVARGFVDLVDVTAMGVISGPNLVGKTARVFKGATDAARARGMRGAIEVFSKSDDPKAVTAALSAADETIEDFGRGSAAARQADNIDEAEALAARMRRAERDREELLRATAPKTEKQIAEMAKEPPVIEASKPKKLKVEGGQARKARLQKQRAQITRRLEQDVAAVEPMVASLEKRVQLQLGIAENVDPKRLAALNKRIDRLKRPGVQVAQPKVLANRIADAEEALESLVRSSRLPKNMTKAQQMFSDAGQIDARLLKQLGFGVAGGAIALDIIRRSDDDTFSLPYLTGVA